MPGDSFRTTCYYEDGSAFGLASAEEMCITFMLYYPVKTVSPGFTWNCYHGFDVGTGCETQLEQADLDGVDDLERIFGTSSGECAAASSVGSTSKSLSLHWVCVYLSCKESTD